MVRRELVRLLDEYLRQGFVGPATSNFRAARDSAPRVTGAW
jgi:hypothetical protein